MDRKKLGRKSINLPDLWTDRTFQYSENVASVEPLRMRSFTCTQCQLRDNGCTKPIKTGDYTKKATDKACRCIKLKI
jgi:hypothetical protein